MTYVLYQGSAGQRATPQRRLEAVKVVFTTQPSGAVNGVAFTTQPVVQLQDANNQPVPTAGTSVTITLAQGGEPGSVSLSGTVTVATDGNGVATFTDLVLTGTASNRNLQAESGALQTASSASFALTAGAATKLAMVTQPAGAVEAVAFTTQPAVRLQDQSSNNVSQASVNVSVVKHAGVVGTLSGTSPVATNASGIATFTDLAMSAAESGVTLDFSASGLTGVTSSAFTVASAGGSAFDFFTDWRAGNTTDGGKLVLWGGGPAISVVSASGLGMPASMANVLQVALGTGNFDWAQANNAWTVPAIGGWRYFRVYIRLVVGAVSGGFASTHPMESEGGSTSVSGAYYALHVGSNTDLSFPWMLDIGGFGGQWTTPNWTGGAPGTLTQSVTYRIEWGYLRTATSTYTIDMRIYGADDSTLLHDKNDLEWWGQSSGNMASGGGGQNIDTAHMEDLRFGINGGAIPSGNLYYGGFATRLGSAGDWCGPHTSNG